MDWSPQQEAALKSVDAWLKDPDRKQIFRLFGYAGTGKTTLARHLAEGVNGDVLFAAYTGKAASVLKESGVPNAQTLHSLIYRPKQQSAEHLAELEAELAELEQMRAEDAAEGLPQDARKLDRVNQLRGEIRKEGENLRRPDFSLNLESPLALASLLVVDECSMVGEDMAEDILSFGVPVLVLGDPAQLPPVKGTGVFTNAEPDAMLTEIHRQARDNPIIHLATLVRNGEQLQPGDYGDSQVIARANQEIALAADQIIVGRNKTRTATNRRMRDLLGHSRSPFPLKGEKLICLRNNKDHGLLNGTIHYTAEDSPLPGPEEFVKLILERDPYNLELFAHKEHFNGDPDDIPYRQRLSAQEFTFGYSITCHKSQGSQWNNVMVIDESGAFRQKGVPQKWLYTAITRAAERITVITN